MTLEQRIAYYVGQGMDLMSARRNAEEDIRQRLSEIRDNNNNIRTAEGERQEALRNAGSAFGNVEAVGNDNNIEGVNTDGIIVDERTALEGDLSRVHEMISNAEQGYLRDQYLNERNEQAQPSISEQLKQLQEKEAEVRQRLSEIRDNNNEVRTAEGERQEALRNAGSAFGNIEAISDNIDSNDIIVDERTELQNELTQLLTSQSALAAQLRQEKIEQDKLDRQTRLDEVNKKAALNEAYKFFTYLDTATTKGYDVSGLSSDEVLDLYSNFRNDENYRAKYEETIARMQTEDREVIIPDDATKDEQNPIEQDSEEVKPSAFATNLYAGGNNPMFENLEAAMAYAAAHPELEESWIKDNEVQNKREEEFDPSHALPAGDEPEFDPTHALPPGDEMPPETAQAGESKPADENLKDRFKNWWKKHWSKVVTAAVALVVIGVTATFIGDAVSAQAIQDAANAANQFDTTALQQTIQDTMNQNFQALGTQSVPTEQVVQATQMYDPSVDMSQLNNVYSDAYSASAGVDGFQFDQSAGQVYTGDFFNPDTGQYAGVDTSTLTTDQVQQLGEQGYTVPLYTNDPSMMAADGNTIANAGAATGFGGPTR